MQPRRKRKRSKFGNIITNVDGIKFHSKKEAHRYAELKLLEKANEIQNLRLQVPYPCKVYRDEGGQISTVIGKYIADFVYILNGEEVVEDVKGYRTDIYRWKKKHVEAQYGIQILET